jgi:hypothetical protein
LRSAASDLMVSANWGSSFARFARMLARSNQSPAAPLSRPNSRR